MIEVSEVSKRFGPVSAVDQVSMMVARGEIVGLLGPNGAGKTTTMRMMTGFLQADAGRLRIDEIDVASEPLRARSRIGYLPENAPLYHDMEVTDFLRYVARLRKLPRGEHLPRLRDMVERCSLGEVVGRPIGQLSKGYRQRVGLAAAMLHRPPVLILDEPTSGLDPNQIQEIRQLIREIGRECTVVLSTHILQEVEAVCQRAVIINRGKVVGEGTIGELMARGRGRVRYHLHLQATEPAVREHARALHGAQLIDCRSTNGEWHEVVFEATNGMAGTDFFDWTVAHGWKLQELRREAASLEEVFRQLTA
ncbi:MAG: ATP-binding cassette domain-containing protein [Deltaproteobacteria bacterium]|nr:ATP-binding cassette domain-containing protein [Deltaproteobacteria bacterium]